MHNKQLIQDFYKAFALADAERMVACYADEIVFIDPAFGVLNGDDTKNMWRMLLQNNKDIKITVRDIEADAETGSAKWIAVYTFTRTRRLVINKVTAQFKFKDGKIIKHTDTFDLWKWAGQALGFSGYLLGWSSFMRNKIQQQATGLLKKYKARL